MRARSWAMRDGFPDVLKGIGIAEEVRDFPPEAYNDAAPVAQRITRAALADHAAVADAEYSEIETESPQTPSPIDTPPVEGAETVLDPKDGAEKQEGAAPSTKPLWMTLVDGLVVADNLSDIETFAATFDANEDEIPIDRLVEVQDAINAARARLQNGE